MHSKVDLSIIIVNYNTRKFILQCLESIEKCGKKETEVIVVDNASRDRSPDLIADNFPHVALIRNQRNVGFARANNQASRVSRGRYLYFLNPDTILRDGALEKPLEYMDKRKEVGLAGTRLLNPDGTVQPSVGTRYPGGKHAKEELSGLNGDIAWVLGASMITRRRLFMELGGFDEKFFLYGEEQDLCLRIRKAGSIIGYVPEAVVIHWGGVSEKDTTSADLWKKKLVAEITFYRNHYKDETIRRIRRDNLLQALWRMATLSIAIPLSGNREKQIQKLEKYRTIWRTFRDLELER